MGGKERKGAISPPWHQQQLAMVEGRSRRRWVVAGAVLAAAAIVAAVIVLTGNARDKVKTDSAGSIGQKALCWACHLFDCRM
jgi:hypothetical protein